MHREGAFLTASPNPVPIGGTGGLRGTTISWSTGDGSEGQVYLAVRGQPEQLFAQGSRGFQEAPWISPSATFEFRLYAGTEHKVLLASVKVVARDEAAIRDAETLAENLQTELFRGLLRNCYEYYGNTIDFWRFPSSRINRSKVWIKDRLLLFAKRIGFVPRDKGIEGTLERLTWVLGNLERLDNFYRLLRDDYSKQLLVDLLKFRVLREKRVKLPLNNSEYWSKRKSVDKNFLKKRGTLTDPGNWPLNHYQLQGLCGTLNLHADPLTVLEIFIQQQYAYRQSGRVIEVQPGDVIIDGGGLWGETALYFADKTEAKGKVYCFEFVPDNLEILQRNIEFNQHLADSIVVILKALWDISGETLEYSPNGPATSVMYTPEQWPWQVQTIAIDDLVEEEHLPRVDYIKMDIEGAELKALRGAERTIRTFRPKLAVSLYHNWDDFILIPDYLNNLSLGYEFFLDHFTIHAEETVLFANPKG